MKRAFVEISYSFLGQKRQKVQTKCYCVSQYDLDLTEKMKVKVISVDDHILHHIKLNSNQVGIEIILRVLFSNYELQPLSCRSADSKIR